jgi:hypothetical protein
MMKKHIGELSWAIAGRSVSKLNKVKARVLAKFPGVEDIPII